MKKLFYLVLILNAGFFAWMFTQDKTPAPEVTIVAEHTPSLVLLDEAKSIPGTDVKQAPTTETEQSQIQIDTPEDTQDTISQQPKPAETTTEEVTESPAQVPGKQQVGASTGEEKTMTKVTDDKTLSENKDTQETVSCFELGSFPTMAVADKVSDIFRATGIQAESRLHIEEQQQGQVIYIPTEGSYAKATGIIALVKEKGIQDYAILAVNGVRNTVVMGIFRTNTAATRRLEQLKSHGFDARMQAHIRKRPQYLVDFRESDAKPVPEELWSRISHDYPRVNRAARVCE